VSIGLGKAPDLTWNIMVDRDKENPDVSLIAQSEPRTMHATSPCRVPLGSASLFVTPHAKLKAPLTFAFKNFAFFRHFFSRRATCG
jgi:hypothetical protein